MAAAASASSTGPSDEDLEAEIGRILSTANLETISMNVMRTELGKRMGLDVATIDSKKAVIQAMTIAGIERLQSAAGGDAAATDTSDDSDDAPLGKTEKKSKKVKKDKKEKKDKKDKKEKKESPKKANAKEPPKRAKARTSSMTVKQYMEKAKAVPLRLGEKDIVLAPKAYSTGSCGLFAQERVKMDVGGTTLTFQVAIQSVAIGSKEWEK
eukprot:TRINITY_DN232_c0_g1_i2.p1 TRINITY_DN232_c0_g1~~TRINITY_DN232_c0_g1_i2.p1  ORF type:complete len:211 (-),score=64.94 TRINITY_DN232_c0_g1_i2:23-655(-)